MSGKSLLELDQEATDAAPAWAVSYGDMMSLLLTLFVMLLSMSEIKQNDKFQGVADSLHEQFRFFRGTQPGLTGERKPRIAPLAVLAVAGREARRRLLHSDKHQTIEPGALSTYAIEFEYASSDPTAGSNGRLEALARMLVSTPQSVEIRGVATSLADAELAWQRAQAVAKVLVEQAELEPSRLRLTVSGTSGKVATTGPAGLLEKSMVEVVLLGEPAVDVAARPAPLR